MRIMKINVTEVTLSIDRKQELVCGSVNDVACEFDFSPDWDGLAKVAVFTGGDVSKAVMLKDDTAVLPWETLTKANVVYTIGVYGYEGDALIRQTSPLFAGCVRGGTDTNAENCAEPTPELIHQAVTAASEACRLASVLISTGSGDSFLSDDGTYKAAPVGLPGNDGKSAYQTAVEGGYSGSEAEFAIALDRAANLDATATKYIGTITGDGSTAEFSVAHNLGYQHVVVEIYDSRNDLVRAGVKCTGTNDLTVSFDSTPAVGEQYTVLVLALGVLSAAADIAYRPDFSSINADNVQAAIDILDKADRRIAEYCTDSLEVFNIPLESGYWNVYDGTKQENANRLRSIDLLPLNSTKRYAHFVSDLVVNGVSVVYFDAEKKYISSTGTAAGTGWNVAEFAPDNAEYFTVHINFSQNVTADDAKVIFFSPEYADKLPVVYGYLGMADDRLMVGYNSNYKLLIKPVKKGDLVKVTATVTTSVSPLALCDSEMNVLTKISPIVKFTDYMAIAAQDGYAISTCTADREHDVTVLSNWETGGEAKLYSAGYMKDGALVNSAEYRTSECFPVRAGDNVVINGYCSSGADIVTKESAAREAVIAGADATMDHWYAFYAEEDTILRFSNRAEEEKPLTVEVTHPDGRLNGKRIAVLGDSYFAGNNLGGSSDYARNHVWINLLALRNNMTLDNYGKNGDTMATFDGSNDTPASVDELAPVCVRYALLEGDYDFIIFGSGRNDYNNNVPLGNYGSTDNATFYGALRNTIMGLLDKFPSASIVAHPCWSFDSTANGINMYQTDYKDAFFDCCEKMGVQFIDTRRNGVTARNATFRSRYFMSGEDISHFNADGHRRYVEFAENSFRTLF